MSSSSRRCSSPTLRAALIGVLVGLAVTAALSRRGWPALLDWPAGPHRQLPAAAMGRDGALLDSFVPELLLWSLTLVPAGGWLAAMLPLVLVWPALLTGGVRLARALTASEQGVQAPNAHSREQAHPWVLWATAALCVLNPFVVQRLLAGQLWVLFGYAMLLHCAAGWVGPVRKPRPWVGWALSVALLAAVSPHFAVVGAVTLLVLTVGRCRWRDLLACAAAVTAATCYLWVPRLLLPLPVLTGSEAAQDFALAGEGGLPQVITALLLSGFWHGPQVLTGLWAAPLAGAVLMLLVCAVWRCWRGGLQVRLRLAALGAAALLASLGVHGPAGPLYRALLDTLPLASVLREPGKLLAVTALAYAALLAPLIAPPALRDSDVDDHSGGDDHDVQPSRGRSVWLRGASAAAGVAVLAAVSVPAAVALIQDLTADGGVRHPDQWQQVNRALAADEAARPCAVTGTPGPVLVLPFRQYLRSSASGGALAANPAAVLLDRPVIVSTDPDLHAAGPTSTDPRTAALNEALAAAPAEQLAATFAATGACYVLVIDGPALRGPGLAPVLTGQHVSVSRLQAVRPQPAHVRGSGYLVQPGRGTVVLNEPCHQRWDLTGRARLGCSRAGALTVTATSSVTLRPHAVRTVWLAAGVSALLTALLWAGTQGARWSAGKR